MTLLQALDRQHLGVGAWYATRGGRMIRVKIEGVVPRHPGRFPRQVMVRFPSGRH